MKSGFAATLGGIAAASLLVAGTAMAGQSSTNDSSMHKSSMQDSSMKHSSMGMHSMGTNRFGGPIYNGQPALAVTVALVKAGGGPGHFSLVTALNHMLGHKTVKAEVAKLTKQYGAKRVKDWVKVMNFYVADTLKIVKKKGIKLPPPAKLSGIELATTLVKAGTDKDGVFWAGYLFDHALSHGIHVQLMNDADAKYGAKLDANAHAITNQAFYDVAHALGHKNVKLAPFHQ
ncbi:MAG: hypothetical protein ACRETC_07460 [Gammaproteobacteria bacterium]